MRVLITGGSGMVGKSLLNYFGEKQDLEICAPTRSELDCFNLQAILDFLETWAPDCVIHLAAKVGGIIANNNFPGKFIYENLLMNTNVIHGCHLADVNKLIFLGSACIYPKDVEGKLTEEMLLKGKLEATNEPYAISKIAGIKMCESYNREFKRDFRSIVPTNIYGPNDNFYNDNSHVIPALISRFHSAVSDNKASISIWGSGAPIRDFLYVDDLCRAIETIMRADRVAFEKIVSAQCSHVNIGSGRGVSIKDLVCELNKQFNYKGNIIYDLSKPDGMRVKILSCDRMQQLGWTASTDLSLGLQKTINGFLKYFR